MVAKKVATKKKKTISPKLEKIENARRFAAIDFETADYGRDSACAVSVVVVENKEVVKKKTTLIRPPRRDFVFSYLHGITWDDVSKKPVFGRLWPELEAMLDGVDFIAAHNASFDRGVLHECCAMHGLNPPDTRFLCTMKLARRVWNLRPTKLSDVCRHFKIPLKHHDAGSDALACAKIVIEAMESGIPQSAFLPKKVFKIGN